MQHCCKGPCANAHILEGLQEKTCCYSKLFGMPTCKYILRAFTPFVSLDSNLFFSIIELHILCVASATLPRHVLKLTGISC